MNMMDGFTLGKGSCPPSISKLSIKVHTNLRTSWWHGFVTVADVTKHNSLSDNGSRVKSCRVCFRKIDAIILSDINMGDMLVYAS